MKKLRSVLAVCLMLLLLASVCSGFSFHGGSGQAAFQVPKEFDTSKTYELTFWAKNDTNASQTAIYNKAIEDFQALYPNVKVTMKLYSDYRNIYNDVITNIATGTTPNICITYPDHIATYLSGDNIVVPLNELMEDKKYGLGGKKLLYDGPDEDEIVPEFLEECKIGDLYYALPYMRSTEACYVNKTYVEALGYTLPEVLTWDFVWEVSEAAMAKNEDGTFKVNGQKVMIPFIYKSTDNMMIQLLKQTGGGYSTSGGGIEIFNDTTTSLLQTIYEHAKTRSFSTFGISSYPGNYLNAGQCIFAVDSTAGSTWMGSEAPLMEIDSSNVVEFETVVMPIPQADTENPSMISQGPSICIFNKEDSQEVLASWLFAQFLLTDSVQVPYAETEGYVPVTTKAQNSEAYQNYLSQRGADGDEHYYVKIDATQLLLDHTEDTFVTPVFNGSTSLRNAAGQMIENVTKSARRGETLDEAYIENLYSSMVTQYRLDQIENTGPAELGPMPSTAKWLLGLLGGAWVCILMYVGCREMKRRKARAGKNR